MPTAGELGERGLIARLAEVFSRRRPRGQVVGIGDDAAVLDFRGQLVVSVDSIESGVDWFVDRTPRDAIGHRAAAVNLSDIAAMGATPRALLLAVDVPRDLAVADILTSALAFDGVAAAHGCAVVGGDVSIGGQERWSVTAIGHTDRPPWRRADALPGDSVWLLGDVGMAGVGLWAMANDIRSPDLADCLSAHLKPNPQCEKAREIGQIATRCAAIDVSDGLFSDAAKIASASNCGLELTIPRPPWLTSALADLLRTRDVDWRTCIACGGDDYALLVTTDPALRLPGRHIGHVLRGAGVTLTIDGVLMGHNMPGHEHR